MAEPAATIPFTIVTGFLGAGKTSLVKHLLQGDHGHRLALIINEFGEVNIDRQLIAVEAWDGILELTNGCVCCAVHEDLLNGLDGLLERRRNGALQFDHVVMETTGLAKAGPIVQTLSGKTLKQHFHLNSVVTVVDAFHLATQLHQYEEAQEQVGTADIILLNKTDLADDSALAALTTRLSDINGLARITRCRDSKVDAGEILAAPISRHTDIWAQKRVAQGARGHTHSFPDRVRSFTISFTEPLDHGRVQDWLSYVIMRYSERLLRYKGILNVHDRSSRIVVQGLHSQIAVTADRDWSTGEQRQTTFVFIGKNLPEAEFRNGLRQCIATTES